MIRCGIHTGITIVGTWKMCEQEDTTWHRISTQVCRTVIQINVTPSMFKLKKDIPFKCKPPTGIKDLKSDKFHRKYIEQGHSNAICGDLHIAIPATSIARGRLKQQPLVKPKSPNKYDNRGKKHKNCPKSRGYLRTTNWLQELVRETKKNKEYVWIKAILYDIRYTCFFCNSAFCSFSFATSASNSIIYACCISESQNLMLKNCLSQHNQNCLELFSVKKCIRKTWPCYVRTIKVYNSFYRSMSASWQHNLHIKKTYYPHKFFLKEKINESYYFSNWSCQLSFQAS